MVEWHRTVGASQYFLRDERAAVHTELSHLLTKEPRPLVVADLAELAEQTVSEHNGVSGVALRTAMKAAKAVDSNIVTKAVDKMLPDILGALNPRWAAYCESESGSFAEFLAAQQDSTAESLLAVADSWAEQSDSPALDKIYQTVRGRGFALLVPAIPGLGRVIEEHARCQ